MNEERPGERLWPLGLTLVALALAWLPHARRLPPWLGPLLAALVLLRFAYSRFGWKLPGRIWLLAPTAAGALWAILWFRPFFGGTGAIALLTVMAALKLFEMRDARDRMVVSLLGYVLVATRFLYEQTPLTALWMLALAFTFTYLLAETQDLTGRRTSLNKAGDTVRLFLYALPVALVLFMVFPRVGSPLLSLRGRGNATTGLSGEMRPGSVSNLAESEDIAFRAALDAERTVGVDLYWRGPVFENFDGQTWRPSPFTAGPLPSPPPSGQRVNQTIIAEETGTHWLTPLDRPLLVSGELVVGGDGVVRSRNGGRVHGGSYAAISLVGDLGELLTEDQRGRLLELPEGTSGQVLELGRSLRPAGAGDREVINRTLGYFRAGEFTYTLTPPLLGADPVSEFLFTSKRGFCEHYASSTAVLLRAASIPARVVTGYLGGEYNPFGNHWIVQQRHAHAWVEAYLPGRGWVRVDPTAAVSPERLSGAIDFAASLRDGVVRFSTGGVGLLSGVRQAADFFTFWWNDWVVGFGPAKQRELLGLLGLSSINTIAWLALICLLFPLLWFAVLYGVGAWAARKKVDPADRAWIVFCEDLAGRGVARLPHEPPYGFAERASVELPELAGDIIRVARLYARCRYGRKPTAAMCSALMEAVRKVGRQK